MIRSLILSYYQINLSFASLLVSLVVTVLFIFSLQDKTNSQPKPRSVSSWVILAFRGVIAVNSLDINRYFISTDVTFFKDSSFFSSAARPPVPNVSSIPLVLPSPDFPSPPIEVATQPLQVYTRRPRPPLELLVEASSIPQSSLGPVLQPSDDLPIAIQKGTHILFIILSAFIGYLHPTLPLFLPCLLSLPLNALVRLSLFRAENGQWLRKWMLFTPMAHGSLSLFLLASIPLVVVGFIQ